MILHVHMGDFGRCVYRGCHKGYNGYIYCTVPSRNGVNVYSYLNIGQPAEDTTKFDYKVTSAKLGYTYVTAFHKPENAWMVPTWFFQVMRSEGQAENMKDLVIIPVAINAMDGGVIVAQ